LYQIIKQNRIIAILIKKKKMENEQSTKPTAKNADASKGEVGNEPKGKMPRKKKKKHNSALAAAAQARSATSGVDANAYRDGGFSNTGTNLSYREDV
jgi:hypothetical protein